MHSLATYQRVTSAACRLLNNNFGQRVMRNRGGTRAWLASQLTAGLRQRLSAFLADRWHPVRLPGGTDYAISLTSWRPRLPELPLVLLTLLQQQVCPSAIFVWLTRDDMAAMDPVVLARFSEHGVLFRTCDDLKPHKKWLPLIEEGYHGSFVICDDDILYPAAWLKHLVQEDRDDAYVGSRCHEIRYAPGGVPLSYTAWNHDVGWQDAPSHDLFLTGCGGAVIHPERVSREFRDRRKIMEWCPSADDIWLKAAHAAAGIPCYKTRFSFPCLELPGSEASGLLLTNGNEGMNDLQIENLRQHHLWKTFALSTHVHD